MSHQIKIHLKFQNRDGLDQTMSYMGRCPFLLAGTSEGELGLTLHFCVTEEKLGWAKALAANPEFVGADEASYELLPNVPDRSGELRMTPAATPPCGAKCPECPSYLKQCGGCPVTPFHRAGYRFK